MKNSGALMQKWNQLVAKKKQPPTDQPLEEYNDAFASRTETEENPGNVRRVLSSIWKIVFALRRVVLAVPVIVVALRLAAYNRENLPVLVGINLQSNGEFAQMISRDTAVSVPLLITLGCLSLLLFTRKTIYPWLISIFTLVIPILLMLTNGYLV